MTTNMTKKDNDTIKITLESAQKLDAKLRELNEGMMKKGLAMCPLLYNMANTNGYVLLGYDNVYDYANEVLGRSRGMTSQYINIASRFFKPSVKNPELKSSSIIERYKDFKVTQLNEIRFLTDEQVDNFKITPKSKIADIKAIVASIKNEKLIENKVEEQVKSHNKEMAKNDNATAKDFISKDDKETREEIKKDILEKQAKALDLANLKKEVRKLLVDGIDLILKNLNEPKLNELKDNPVKLSFEINDTIFEYDLANCGNEELIKE